jgi:hypothetical protein
MAYKAETGCSKSLNKEINKVGCDWFFFCEIETYANGDVKCKKGLFFIALPVSGSYLLLADVKITQWHAGNVAFLEQPILGGGSSRAFVETISAL